MRISDWSSDVCSSDLFYVSLPLPAQIHPWVQQNVIPYLRFVPAGVDLQLSREQAARHIGEYLANDSDPMIVADWPDDLAYFCHLLVTGPGEMIAIGEIGRAHV